MGGSAHTGRIIVENQTVPQKSGSSPAWLENAKEYITDLQMEMRRVTWPTWKQVRATTTVVIVSVFAFAAYFRAVDFLVERGVSRIFSTLTR
jgi:preprotein translocase subunit SecE